MCILGVWHECLYTSLITLALAKGHLVLLRAYVGRFMICQERPGGSAVANVSLLTRAIASYHYSSDRRLGVSGPEDLLPMWPLRAPPALALLPGGSAERLPFARPGVSAGSYSWYLGVR